MKFFPVDIPVVYFDNRYGAESIDVVRGYVDETLEIGYFRNNYGSRHDAWCAVDMYSGAKLLFEKTRKELYMLVHHGDIANKIAESKNTDGYKENVESFRDLLADYHMRFPEETIRMRRERLSS